MVTFTKLLKVENFVTLLLNKVFHRNFFQVEHLGDSLCSPPFLQLLFDFLFLAYTKYLLLISLLKIFLNEVQTEFKPVGYLFWVINIIFYFVDVIFIILGKLLLR